MREESTIQALRSYEKLQAIWNSCFSSPPSEFSRIHSFSHLVMLFFSSHINSEVFAMTCWAIWNRRNKVWVGEVVWPLHQIAGLAQKHLQEFHKSRPSPRKKVHPCRPWWEPPDQGGVKTKIDGAIFKDINAADLGVVIRNDRGKVLAATVEKIPIPDSVLTLETLAARRVVQFVHEVGIFNSIFEGDSETSINALRKGQLLHYSFGHIVRHLVVY